jgi:hypothetical protein
MPDSHKNFAYSTVATAPVPAASGLTLVVFAGDGAKFPSVSFNATVWPANTQPTTANAEIVRVTNIATDTFTITRAQESSAARSIVVGDQIAATITVKAFTDIENTLAPYPASGTSGGVLGFTGPTTAASSAALGLNGVVIGGGAGATPTAIAAATTGQVIAGNTGSAPTPQAATSLGCWQLLKANSGTDTSAAAANVDTLALTGLTAKDTLRIMVNCESVTQQTAGAMIYDNTGGAQIGYLHGNAAIAAAAGGLQEVVINPRQGSNTALATYTMGGSFANGNLFTSNGGFTIGSWTGGFTIALRHTGVTAGGTFKWTWAVYVLRGQ